MKMKKTICFGLAALLAMSALSGCGGKTGEVDGKVNVSVGGWPDGTDPEKLERQNKIRDEFMAENPDINIIPDTYTIDTKTFLLKAAAKQLPTMYHTWFTEIKPNIRSGYAVDITDVVKKNGYDKALNPALVELCSDENGRIYGLPTDAYYMGLFINKKMFKEAGLVNADGSIMIPRTYEDVAKFSQTIKEKTGKAGFIMPSTNNIGGWHFINIAWAFGVEEFSKEREDGTREACFNTQEAIDALQYVKDLKWKYNALLDQAAIGYDDLDKYFGTYQAAMFLATPPRDAMFTKQGMAIEDLMVVKIPEGPKGRFSQTGGSLWMFSEGTTPEQVDAGIKWLKFSAGYAPEIADTEIARMKESNAQTIKNGGTVADRPYMELWISEENRAAEKEARAEYVNLDPADYEDYRDLEGVTIKPEPYAAQQLYAVLDKVIQEVITNENANVADLIASANEDFQLNHLDKEE